MKKIAIIQYNEKNIFVDVVREVDSVEFLKLREEAKQNLKELTDDYKKTKEEVACLFDEVEKLKHEIKILKGEE